MQPEFDEYGVMIRRKPSVPATDEYGVPIKKKELGGLGSGIGGGIGILKSASIADKVGKIGSVLDVEEFQEDPIGYHQKQLEQKVKSDWNSKEGFTEANAGRVLGERYREVDELKKKAETIAGELFHDVKAAREYIKSTPNLNENNKTHRVAVGMVQAHDTNKEAFKNANQQFGSFEESAAKLLDGRDLKEIPEAKAGELIDRALQSDVAKELASESQDFANKYYMAKANLYNHFPSYAQKKVATLISQKLEDDGTIGWFYANPNVKKVDEAVKKLEEEGKFGNNEKMVYEEKLRPVISLPGGAEKVLKLPDVMHRTGYGIETGLKGIEGSMRTIVNKVAGAGWLDPKGESLFQKAGLLESNEGRTKRIEQEESGTPTVEAKRFGTKYLGGAMEFTGQFVPLIAGQAAGIPHGANIVLNFLGHNSDNAIKYFPDDVGKQNLYAAGGTLIDLFAMKMFPTAKVADGFKKLLTPTMVDLTKKLANKEITADVFKKSVLERVATGLAQIGKGNTNAANALFVFEKLHNGLDAVAGKRDFNLINELSEGFDNYKTNWLNSSFLSGVGVMGKQSPKTGSIIYSEMARTPEYFRELVTENKELSPQDKKERLENLDHIEITSKQLELRGVPENKRAPFIALSLKEKTENQAAANTPDKTLAKHHENAAKVAEIEKELELDPKISNTQHLEKIYDYLPTDIKTALTTEGKFDENKVGDFLKLIAQQVNRYDNEWNPQKEKGTLPNLPNSVIEMANKRWEKELNEADAKQQPENKIGEVAAEEISQPIELKPELPEGYILPEEVKREMEVNIPELKRPENEQPIVKENIESVEPLSPKEEIITETVVDKNIEPSKEGEEKPPTGEAEILTEGGESDKLRLSHADTEKIYEEGGLPLRLETPTKHRAQLEAEADERLQKGYDFDKTVKNTLEGEHRFDDVDQVLFARKVADLKAKQKGMDIKSEEFDLLQSQIEKLSRASDVAGTIGGRFLESRKHYQPIEESISEFVQRDKEAAGVEILTDKQKDVVQKEFTEISEADKVYQDKIQALQNENARLRAEAEVKKTVSTTKKGQKKDFKREREAIFVSIKEKLAKARGETSATILPYAKELIAISPDIAKLMKSYIEQGVVELADIVKKIHEDLKPHIPDATEKDIQDVIAGEHTPKKRTRNELAEKVFNLKREAQLINKLDRLIKGELPTSERQKRIDNKKIEDLKKEIEDVKNFGREVGIQKESVLEAATKRQQQIVKELSKAEKEVDVSEQKERRGKLAAAEKERKQIEREFEKEKRGEEKAKLKLKLEDAKRVEKELSYRTPEEKRLDTYKSNVSKEIATVERQLKTGDFSVPAPKDKIVLDEDAKALRDNLIQLRQKRELRLLLQKRQNEGNNERALRYTAEIANVPRTLMTILDFSGLFRQNIFFAMGHPVETARHLPKMFKSFTKQEVYDRWFNDVKEDPRYQVMKDSKLAITNSLSHDLTEREEAYMSTLAEKVPIIGETLNIKGKTIVPGLNVVKGSERSYNMLLNQARVTRFNELADALEERGITYDNSPKVYKAVAEYINNATGRSDFGKTLNKIAPILNAAFFSPRLIASRINMLTYWMQPRFWKTLPKEVRIDYMRGWLSFLGTGLTIMALAKAGGADVEDDPRSSDFGKIKSGDTRWDMWAGSQQYVRVLAQMISGKRKSTGTGKMYDLNGDDIFGETRTGVGMDFLRNKLAPVPGAAIDLLSGRTGIGDRIMYQWGGAKEKQISIDQYIAQRLLPMTITGTKEAMKDQGLKALLTVGVPNIFGVGTSTYGSPKKDSNKPQRPSKPKINKPVLERR